MTVPPGIKVWARRVVAIGGIGLTLVTAAAWLTRDSWGPGMIVVPPSPQFAPVTRPSDVHDVIQVERAGAKLRAWIFRPDRKPIGTVVLLHGIRDDKRNLVGAARHHVRRGWQALAVDLRGHGESSGKWLTYGVEESQDIAALVDEMERRKLLVHPLVVYGASIAIQFAARDQRVQAVAALAPFASLREVVPAYVSWLLGGLSVLIPSRFVKDIVDRSGATAGFDPDEACPRCVAPRIAGSVLLIHSRDDERIPYQHSVAIKQATRARSRLMLVDGVSHVAIGGAPGVEAAVDAWLMRSVPTPVATADWN